VLGALCLSPPWDDDQGPAREAEDVLERGGASAAFYARLGAARDVNAKNNRGSTPRKSLRLDANHGRAWDEPGQAPFEERTNELIPIARQIDDELYPIARQIDDELYPVARHEPHQAIIGEESELDNYMEWAQKDMLLKACCLVSGAVGSKTEKQMPGGTQRIRSDGIVWTLDTHKNKGRQHLFSIETGKQELKTYARTSCGCTWADPDHDYWTCETQGEYFMGWLWSTAQTKLCGVLGVGRNKDTILPSPIKRKWLEPKFCNDFYKSDTGYKKMCQNPYDRPASPWLLG